VRVHASAAKHDVDHEDIVHAFARQVAIVDLKPDSKPVLDGDDLLVIHAMPLRPIFYRYLPDPTE
jgi:hypothetical protein